jgi:hypothetical protein
MKPQEAARRYLQASMNSSYTGLPVEAKQIQEGTMRKLEREHPDVRRRAIAGTNLDFDKPLEPGEREHQTHLRDNEGYTQSQLHETRRELRDHGPARTNRPSTRRAVRAGAAGGRTYARSRRAIAQSAGVQSTGSIMLEAVGVAIGLSLLYLALSPKGSKAFGTLLNGVSGFLRVLIAPIDPLNPKGATGRAAAEAQNATPQFSGAYTGGPTAERQHVERRLKPQFGPAPGIAGPLGLVGGGL